MSMKCLTLQHGDVALSQTSQTDAKYPVLPNVVFCSLLGSNIRIFIIIFPPQMHDFICHCPSCVDHQQSIYYWRPISQDLVPEQQWEKEDGPTIHILYRSRDTVTVNEVWVPYHTIPTSYRFTKRDYLEYYTQPFTMSLKTFGSPLGWLASYQSTYRMPSLHRKSCHFHMSPRIVQENKSGLIFSTVNRSFVRFLIVYSRMLKGNLMSINGNETLIVLFKHDAPTNPRCRFQYIYFFRLAVFSAMNRKCQIFP